MEEKTHYVDTGLLLKASLCNACNIDQYYYETSILTSVFVIMLLRVYEVRDETERKQPNDSN